MKIPNINCESKYSSTIYSSNGKVRDLDLHYCVLINQ